MFRFKTKVFVALAASVISIGALQPLLGTNANIVQAASSKTFRVATSQSLDSLDPASHTSMTSTEMIDQITEGLYRYDQKNKVINGLVAGEPKVNADKTVYTYTLKKAKWSNGDAVTANDFVYALRRKVQPKYASSASDYIKNGQAVRLNQKPATELGIKALGPRTLELTLENPIPFIKQYLTSPFFLPIDQKFAEKVGAKFGTAAKYTVSNGPFVLKGWTGTNDTWTLVKNKNYYGAKSVKLDKVSVSVIKETATALNLFDSGRVDYTVVGDSNVQKYTGSKSLHQKTSPTIGFLSLNNKRTDTGNVHLRRALAMAVNKKALTNNFLKDGSKPLNGLITRGLATNPTTGKDYRQDTGDLLSYSPKKAAAEWQKAKKELGKDSIELELLAADTTQAKNVAEFLQSQYEKNLSGLKIDIKAIPVAQRIQFEQNGNYDLAFGTYAPDYGDPMSLLFQYTTGQKLNFSHYSSETYDNLINKARTTQATQPAARYKTLQQAEKVLLDDAAVNPIYQQGISYLLSDRFTGFSMHPFGQIADYRYLQPK
ncbi:MAG: peptide ABC transporter substrate-binding protein [Lactobacillus sp.]|jgi:oligopeptide transport system substrate-binding protein|nr:peptide ABC transporter substrate-binding protein [Lactobacillus sp.]